LAGVIGPQMYSGMLSLSLPPSLFHHSHSTDFYHRLLYTDIRDFHCKTAKYGPRYRTPFAICLCLMFLNGTCVLVTKWFARREALQWKAETEAESSDRENIEVK
jgi:hypothetical protein